MIFKSPPADYTEVRVGMSNFDNRIDEGFEEHLRGNRVYGGHAAWDFYGQVWYEDGLFYETVLVYQSPRKTLVADNLRDLMRKVNEEFGTA